MSADAGTRRRSMLIGLVGEGVAPSLTPPMHEAEGARHAMHYVYRPIDLLPGESAPDALAALLAAARRLGFDGLNVTHPVKQAVIAHLDGLSESARQVGAVNTVVFTEHGAIGHNTDVTGFAAALRDAFGIEPVNRVILLGTGGAGSAVATALVQHGVDELVLIDQVIARAEDLAEQVRRRAKTRIRTATPAELPDLLREADLIVNATPMGMAAHPGTPFETDLLRPGIRVADIVYRPAETALLKEAAAVGCRVMSGLGMAMHQAADAFEIFTGEPADRAAMLADLNDLVAAEATGTLPSLAPERGEPR